MPVRIQKTDKDVVSRENEPASLPTTQRRAEISSVEAPEDRTPVAPLATAENTPIEQPDATRGVSAQIVYGQGAAKSDSEAGHPDEAGVSDEQDIAIQRSFTLYKKDCQAIRDMQVHFLQNGVHVTESQAVRIALRVLDITEKLMAMHNQIRSEDGRRTRKGGKGRKRN